jgi:L-alanine-DL-glutamate epimerase-like enolase superfamily enzyme
VLPVEILREAVESYSPYLQASGEMHDPVFGEPTQWPTLAQIFVAEAAGLPLLVSGLTDGLLTKLAVCQVAAAFGCPGPAALNGSQFTDESALFPSKADVESGGTVHLPSAPGIGVRPDEEALRGHDRRGG